MPNEDAIQQEWNIAYKKASGFCASDEHYAKEVEEKLKYWGVSKNFISSILEKLKEENFINEVRYAQSFARGKFRINGWGKIKITAELRAKGITESLIAQGLSKLDEEDYQTYLRELLEKKLKETGKNTFENRQKAARFAIGRGFEPSLVFEILNEKKF